MLTRNHVKKKRNFSRIHGDKENQSEISLLKEEVASLRLQALFEHNKYIQMLTYSNLGVSKEG